MNSKSYELSAYINTLHLGDHVCSIYQFKTQLFFQISVFFKTGLNHNHKCIYIGYEYSKEEILDALNQSGIDTKKHLDSGQLVLFTAKDVYIVNDTFDPSRVINQLRELEKQSLTDGFAGIYVAGEASWALESTTNTEKLIEYETNVNHFFQNAKAMAICLYDEGLFSHDVLKTVLRRHPYLIIYETVYKNSLCYLPPDAAQSPDAFSDMDYKTLIDKIVTGAPDEVR